MFFSLLLIVSLIQFTVQQGPENSTLDRLYGKPEDKCSEQGGMCISAAQCPDELRAERGLCPTQQSEGFECCFGFPKDETRCKKLCGACMPDGKCPERLKVSRANDCPAGTECCTLV